MPPTVRGYKEVDPSVQVAGEALHGTLTGSSRRIPGRGSHSCHDGGDVATGVEQVQIGHGATAHPHDYVPGLPGDDDDAQIEGTTLDAGLGQPPLDVHALATQCID